LIELQTYSFSYFRFYDFYLSALTKGDFKMKIKQNIFIITIMLLSIGLFAENDMGKGGSGDGASMATTTGDATLPVDLTLFTATQKNNQAILKWQTGSEQENLGFIIERRSDNEEYIEIATYSSDEELTGSGNSSVRSHYSFTDENVVSGTTYEYRISDVDYSGRLTILKSVTVQLVDNGLSGLPNAYALNKAYPNPFNATTTISYELPKSSVVTISVYDINGRFIEELVNENKDAGSHTVRWDASSVSSGVYLYRLVTSEFVSVNKCILLK